MHSFKHDEFVTQVLNWHLILRVKWSFTVCMYLSLLRHDFALFTTIGILSQRYNDCAIRYQ